MFHFVSKYPGYDQLEEEQLWELRKDKLKAILTHFLPREHSLAYFNTFNMSLKFDWIGFNQSRKA